MDDIRENLIHNYEYIGGVTYTPTDNHDHDGVNSAATKLTVAVSPYPLAPSDFIPLDDTQDFTIGSQYFLNRTTLTALDYYAPVPLPNDAIVSKVTLFYYRENASTTIVCELVRNTRVGAASEVMASITATLFGWEDEDDVTINNATIDNESYSYTCHVSLDPDSAVVDAKVSGVLIYWAF